MTYDAFLQTDIQDQWVTAMKQQPTFLNAFLKCSQHAVDFVQ